MSRSKRTTKSSNMATTTSNINNSRNTRSNNRFPPLLLLAALPALSWSFQTGGGRHHPGRTGASSPSPRIAFAPASGSRKRPRFATSTSRREALAIPGVESVESAVDTFFQTQPYVSAFLTCSFKASAADFVAQARQRNEAAAASALAEEDLPFEDADGDDNFLAAAGQQVLMRQTSSAAIAAIADTDAAAARGVDVSRNLGFLVYGGLYQGMFQQFLYNTVFPRIFPDDNAWTTIAAQVGTDMALVTPLLCLPIAYMFKTAFASTGDGAGDSSSLIERGLLKYVADVKERGLLFKYWSLWIPVQTLTFGVVPHHYRIAFIACVSFVWMFILSTVSTASEQEEQQQQQEEVPPSVAASQNSY